MSGLLGQGVRDSKTSGRLELSWTRPRLRQRLRLPTTWTPTLFFSNSSTYRSVRKNPTYPSLCQRATRPVFQRFNVPAINFSSVLQFSSCELQYGHDRHTTKLLQKRTNEGSTRERIWNQGLSTCESRDRCICVCVIAGYCQSRVARRSHRLPTIDVCWIRGERSESIYNRFSTLENVATFSSRMTTFTFTFPYAPPFNYPYSLAP